MLKQRYVQARTAIASAPKTAVELSVVWLLAGLFSAFHLRGVYKYGVNYPWSDEWVMTPWASGAIQPTLANLWRTNAEHHIFVYNLFTWLMGRWTQWNLYYAGFVSAALGIATLTLTLQYARSHHLSKSFAAPERMMILVGFCFILFSPRQLQNLVQPFQIHWVLTTLLQVSFAFLWLRHLRTGRCAWYLAAVIGLGTLAMGHALAMHLFVLASGAMVAISRWIAGGFGTAAGGANDAVISAKTQFPLPRNYGWLAGLSALLLILYFYGVHSAARQSLGRIARDPVAGIRFVFEYLGNFAATGQFGLSLAGWYGLVVSLTFIVVLTNDLLYGGKPLEAMNRFVRERPLLLISIITMLMITAARTGTVPNIGTAWRYVTSSVILQVALGCYILPRISNRVLRSQFVLLFIALAITIWPLSLREARGFMIGRYVATEQVRQCFVSAGIAKPITDPDHPCRRYLETPYTWIARDVAPYLETLRTQRLAFFADPEFN